MLERTGREVWVFGAGITGLTAAHELAERGFQVTVIEKDLDVRFFGEPAVGGMAKTQWALPDDDPAKNLPTRPVLPVFRVSFKPGTADPQPDTEAEVKAYAEGFIAVYKEPYPTVVVRGLRRPDEDARLVSPRAFKLKELLEARLPKLKVKILESERDRASAPESDDFPCAEARVAPMPVPGEHGFRYFPSFYWHVFDTMRRIRLTDDRERPSGRRFQSVLENLVSTEHVTLAARRKSSKAGREPRCGRSGESMEVPRRAPRSLREAFDLLTHIFTDLGHEPSDVAHLALRLTRYMTSGASRRAEYEKMTFADFVQKEKLSKLCQDDLERAPEVLGGMRASEADARTQGNIALQLLLGDLRDTKILDATLNGPTSSVWFLPWRDYLQKAHGVRFRRGKLLRFCKEKAGTTSWVAPEVEWQDLPLELSPKTLIVLAVDLPSLLPNDDKDVDRQGLCVSYLSVQKDLPVGASHQASAGDFEALDRWIRASHWDWNSKKKKDAEAGPMRHLVGLQFFFETNQRPNNGHTIYIDAPWRLSSISQPAFWSVPRSPGGPLGIVSVDIGEWYTDDDNKMKAWCSPVEKLAASVWGQMKETFSDDADKPDYFHLDQAITFAGDGTPDRNRTPYLITRPVDWPLRPGAPEKYAVAGTFDSTGTLLAGGCVLAGTFMKTYTRLTTMESANESARHAVNALLDAIKSGAPRCRVRDVERDEPPDLRPLKDLDDRLYKEGMPHMMDTLRTEEWVASFFRRENHAPAREGRYP